MSLSFFFLAACFTALGMESRKVKDSAITESSALRPTTRGGKARLNYRAGAWYAALNDKSPYIQVNLGQMVNVTGLATQGSTSGQYVTQYRVSYSADGAVWRNYTENGVTKVRLPPL